MTLKLWKCHPRTIAKDETMRVWIGCLSCYNDGELVGGWVDAVTAGSVTLESVHALAGGPREGCEELWCFDIDEAPHESLAHEMAPEEAQRIAERIADLEREHVEPEVFAAWCDNLGENFLSADVAAYEDAYCGAWDSREDFAQGLADDLGLVPDDQPWPLSYIDWERAARDLFMDYTDIRIGGHLHVFRDV